MEEKNNFDSQLQTYFSEIKNKIKQEHVSYIKSHAELRQILNDFLSSILLEQPDNVYTYAQKYFSFFNHQKDQKTYKPLVISGCSGVGKVKALLIQGTIIAQLLSKYPDIFQLSISYTTRGPRVGQVQGRHYYFVTLEEFKKQIGRGVFAQFCQVHGNFYGTHKGKLRDIIERGKICILDIDVHGGEKIHSNFEQCNFLFIDAPNVQELEKRLKGRGTDTPTNIETRLKNAQEEIETSLKLKYYEHMVNDKFEDTMKQLMAKMKVWYPDVQL